MRVGNNMIKICKANLQHLDEMVSLFEAYRVWYRMESNPAAARKFLKERMDNKESEIFLAIDQDTGEAVGFTQLYPIFSSTRMGRVWLLNDLFVAADHRGRGISIQLIDAAKNLARETGAIGISLETEKSNVVGNTLYPRAEFKPQTEENFYFWLAN